MPCAPGMPCSELEAYDFSGHERLVDVAGADLFTSVPAGGDAYVMKQILRDWDDERALIILRRIRAALNGKPHGRLLLIETIATPSNRPARRGGGCDERGLAKPIDLEMRTGPGSRERTEAELCILLSKAGFELTRIVPTASPLSVIEATPRRVMPHRVI